MMSRQKQNMCIFATILALAGCQGAYNTHTGSSQPVLDERVAEEVPLKIEGIPQGGIIMKRSYDPEWEMPKRDVDVLREQFSKLQNELLNMHSGQEKKMLSKFQEVESRVSQMRREELRKAAEDVELMALVKAKFDTVDQNLSFLKASEAQQINEKDALLSVLDDKFQAVEERLGELNKKDDFQNKAHQEELRLAFNELSNLKEDKNVLIRALDKKFNEVENYTELLSEGLKSVEYEQEVQNRLALARKQAMEEAREMRLLEELEMRKEVEQQRREQLSLAIRQAEKDKLATEREDIQRAKRQAEIEFNLASLKKELEILEMQEARRLSESDIRAQAMKESLEIRLSAVKESYDGKFAELEKEKNDLNDRIEMLKAKSKEDLETKIEELDSANLLLVEKQKETLDEKIAELKVQQELALEEAADYRDAIEERIFAMESQKGKAIPVEQESIGAASLKLGRIIETDAQVPSTIEMTASSQGGLVGGYSQEDWIDLEDYQVVLHENNNELQDILEEVLKRAEPYVGPWEIKWKLKEENMDVLSERFSLDVETNFDTFTSYISNYMNGYRGFGLTFNLFKKERILVVTD